MQVVSAIARTVDAGEARGRLSSHRTDRSSGGRKRLGRGGATKSFASDHTRTSKRKANLQFERQLLVAHEAADVPVPNKENGVRGVAVTGLGQDRTGTREIQTEPQTSQCPSCKASKSLGGTSDVPKLDNECGRTAAARERPRASRWRSPSPDPRYLRAAKKPMNAQNQATAAEADVWAVSRAGAWQAHGEPRALECDDEARNATANASKHSRERQLGVTTG